eukprot:13136876-Alexandrium_andersonii.AAC.1
MCIRDSQPTLARLPAGGQACSLARSHAGRHAGRQAGMHLRHHPPGVMEQAGVHPRSFARSGARTQ